MEQQQCVQAASNKRLTCLLSVVVLMMQHFFSTIEAKPHIIMRSRRSSSLIGVEDATTCAFVPHGLLLPQDTTSKEQQKSRLAIFMQNRSVNIWNNLANAVARYNYQSGKGKKRDSSFTLKMAASNQNQRNNCIHDASEEEWLDKEVFVPSSLDTKPVAKQKSASDHTHHKIVQHKGKDMDRRRALSAMWVATLATSAWAASAPALDSTDGAATWIPSKSPSSPKSTSTSNNDSPQPTATIVLPPSFVTYASRILIRYDPSVSSWWRDELEKVRLLPKEEQTSRLEVQFGRLAQSVHLALKEFLSQQPIQKDAGAYASLANFFLNSFSVGQGDSSELEVSRHVGILMSLLPREQQPKDVLRRLARQQQESNETALTNATGAVAASANAMVDTPTLSTTIPAKNDESSMAGLLSFAMDEGTTPEQQELKLLLPPLYSFAYSSTKDGFAITPTLPASTIPSAQSQDISNAIATMFGPLSTKPLTRERPNLGLQTYALLGMSGGVGCALTHSLVIPLDVVKTRMQTDPEGTASYSNMVDGAFSMARSEGWSALFLGAQATLAGFFWYGLSVYPTYTFLKKYIGETVLDPATAVLHANNVSLLAGALAAVVASLGLTPLEACRIRTVANPEKYRALGLWGTAASIASEDAQAGWKTLYAGLNSLLVRQVMFGAVKFLAFERACEAVYSLAPSLKEETATALLVSALAGAFSGTLSCVVSQPADSVLTFVAQRGTEGMGVIQGCKVMMDEEGVGSLFRGLGSRCVWAGSIIAGQFFLYDVFRSMFGVNGEDLSQVFRLVIGDR